MIKLSADPAPWGKYIPRGKQKLLLLLPRSGLSHGRIKKMIAHAWSGSQPDRQPVDVIYQNLKYRLHPWDNAIESKMLFGSRQRDTEEINLLTDNLPDGGVFIDIGANIGYYSLMAARSGAGTVIAVEPNPVIFSRLVFNISVNDFTGIIKPVAVALGNQSGTSTLYLSQEDLGSSGFLQPVTSTESITVSMLPMTELLVEHNINSIDVMKIDIEGFEDSVLFPFFDNSNKTLWPGIIIIEHTSSHLWKRNILTAMLDCGYAEIAQTRSNKIMKLVSRH